VVDVEGDDLTVPLTAESTFGEFWKHPVTGPLLKPFLADSPIPLDDPQLSFFLMESQMSTLATWGIPGFTRETLAALLAAAESASPSPRP